MQQSTTGEGQEGKDKSLLYTAPFWLQELLLREKKKFKVGIKTSNGLLEINKGNKGN